MKSIDDPEFLLLEKAKEIKKKIGESEEIDELIKMAESIINQNYKGALMYIMTALDHVDIKNSDIMQEMFGKIMERKNDK